MAISDHAIDDRAISAPEDVVILVVQEVGRVVLRHAAVGLAELDTESAGAVVLRHERLGEAA
jgi:hypothetical protein